MNAPDDLIGDMIAEVARSHGVAISRDDPILAVVLLNQVVLRRYLEEVVTPVADAIRGATSESIRQVEQFAEDQKILDRTGIAAGSSLVSRSSAGAARCLEG
ncbi:MAG: hypothetical protein VBE63_19665 [Lamprobacter sp.]|uniref:hypothetical protein n=1 Tax=Lamprobacter sp. TaxID=3100796 RepID=UPI002B258CD0|nr:hypothetical protein [Lamprobacter sp.]MEA3642136.1 hypothetical protein [Lamprobacter sp.]